MADNNPYRPSPEILAKLQKLREEFAVRAEMERRRQLGQQNLEETMKALKLPGQAKGGLQKFLEPSKIKDPMYHGTTADIREFKPDRAGATYLTADPNFASKFALNDMLYGSGLEDQSGFINPSANVMKVHVQATNPFDFDNPKHVRAVLSNLDDERDKKAFRKIIKNKTGDNWRGLENFMHIIEDTGFDSAYLREMGRKNLAVFDPRKIKSAIGNRGTYDINNSDITKAKGGLMSAEEREAGRQKFLEPSVEKGVMYHGTRSNVKKFKPREIQAYGGPDAVYLTPLPNVANKFAERKQSHKAFGDPLGVGEKISKGANVMPLHAQVTNPFDVRSEEHTSELQSH